MFFKKISKKKLNLRNFIVMIDDNLFEGPKIMNSQRQKILGLISTKFFLIANLFLCSLAFQACDNNVTQPESNNVSIASFAVEGESTITLGEAVLLKWTVDDKDGKVKEVTLSPDGGSVKATSGSKLMTPTKTTDYTLKAVDGDTVFASRTVHVTVLSGSGNQEVVEEPTLEADLSCVDGVDNDLDDKIDCADESCVEDPTCVIKAPEYTLTWSVEGEKVAGDKFLIGNTVDVKFETDAAQVYVPEQTKYYEASDTIEDLVLTSGLTNLTLQAFDSEGLLVAEELVTIDAVSPYTPPEPEEHEYNVNVAFYAVPSGVVRGQEYQICWNIGRGAESKILESVDERENLSRSSGCNEYTADDSDIDYKLTVADQYGNEKEYTTTVKVTNLELSTSDMSDVKKVFAGKSGTHFVLAKGNKVFVTENDGNSFKEQSLNVEGDIESIAQASDGSYVVTTSGKMANVYVGDKLSGLKNIFEVSKKATDVEYLNVVLLGNGSEDILISEKSKVGTKYFPLITRASIKNGKCRSDSTELTTGWCYSYKTENIVSGDVEQEIVNVIRNENDPKQSIVQTDKGLYLSDNDEKFVTPDGLSNVTDISFGMWKNNYSGTIVVDNVVYDFSRTESKNDLAKLVSISLDNNIEKPKFSVGQDTYRVVATRNEIYLDDENSQAVLLKALADGETVVHIFKSKGTVESRMTSKASEGSYGTVRILTSEGNLYTLKSVYKGPRDILVGGVHVRN